MIIGISGKIGSGKDTVAGIIQDFTDERWEVKKYADKLKRVCHILCGGDITEQFSQVGKNTFLAPYGKTIGEIQQIVGTEGLRDGFDKDVWIKALFVDYKGIWNKGVGVGLPNWIITDVRFKNEAQAIREKGGYLLRMEGDPVGIRAASDRDLSHPSETDLDDWRDWDGMIYNTGTLKDLKGAVKDFLVDLEENNDLKFSWL